MPTTLVSTGVQFPDNSVQTVARTTSNTVTSFNGSVGAVSFTAPVTSVNGMTGAVTVSSTPTTDQVLSATAGASVGAVGTYGIFRIQTTPQLGVGATIAGSSLRWSTANGGDGGAPAGTWRHVGFKANDPYNLYSSVFLRIS